MNKYCIIIIERRKRVPSYLRPILGYFIYLSIHRKQYIYDSSLGTQVEDT